MLEIIKDIDSLTVNDYFILQLENKSLVYRKSKESKLGIAIITNSGIFKKTSLIEMSRLMLVFIEKKKLYRIYKQKNRH